MRDVEIRKPVKLWIIRGLPGSGKSTLAKVLKRRFRLEHHLEADMFFIKDGVRVYDGDRIREAHDWCLAQTVDALTRGEGVVVSNTFLLRRHIWKYTEVAKRLGVQYRVVRAVGDYGGANGVPEDYLEKYRNIFQDFKTERFHAADECAAEALKRMGVPVFIQSVNSRSCT